MTNQEAIGLLKIERVRITPTVFTEIVEAIDMAIKALEAQELSKNSTELDKENGDLQPTCNQLAKDTNVPRKDTISRQAAISELMEWVEKEKNKSWSPFKGLFHWTGIKAMLECLPSAQPEIEERTEEFAQNVPKEDLISRKAAIDAINKALDRETLLNSFVRKVAVDALKTMPPAQPEIIRCKECRWRKDQSGSAAWLPCRAIVTPSDFYCGRAERRTDAADCERTIAPGELFIRHRQGNS